MIHDNAAAPRVADASRALRLGVLSTSSFTVFLAVAVAFHFVQPELHPPRRFVSEYAVGRMGWLLNVAFVVFASGLAALAVAFGRLVDPAARTRMGGALLGMSSLGVLASGLFNADLHGAGVTAQGIAHHVAGFVAFLSLIPGAIVVSRRLAKANRLRGRYRRLRLLAWLLFPLLLAMPLVFGRLGAIGLGQRIFLGGVFAWLLTASHGLRTGAFATDDPRTSPETSRKRNIAGIGGGPSAPPAPLSLGRLCDVSTSSWAAGPLSFLSASAAAHTLPHPAQLRRTSHAGSTRRKARSHAGPALRSPVSTSTRISCSAVGLLGELTPPPSRV